jgi:hypothetical protein
VRLCYSDRSNCLVIPSQIEMGVELLHPMQPLGLRRRDPHCAKIHLWFNGKRTRTGIRGC